MTAQSRSVTPELVKTAISYHNAWDGNHDLLPLFLIMHKAFTVCYSSKIKYVKKNKII